jgi:hypothetical protein
VLAHAVSVVEFDCTVESGDAFVGYSITTDPLFRVDLGYSEQRFVVRVPGLLDDPIGREETELLASPTRYLLDLLTGR